MKRFIGIVTLGLALRLFGAEQYGDVSVAPQTLVSGDTFHGDREFRVELENHSSKNTHQVTLIFPDRSFAMGECISRLSRTVVLAPGARAAVPLWQPPLPLSGNAALRVLVDGEPAGTQTFPNVPRHGPQFYGARFGGPQPPSTILVSRSFDFDQMDRALKPRRVAYAPAAATGPPDSARGSGPVPTAWMPDGSKAGTNWIELNFDRPERAIGVQVYETIPRPAGGEMILTGVSGTNLVRVALSAPASLGSGIAANGFEEFSFPLTAEPVKSVRLDFGPAPASAIAIDAVGLQSPRRSIVWASSARASSQSHAAPPRGRGPGGVEFPELLRPELPVAEWSEHWISYTPFDGIILSGADLASAPPAVLDALWRYTECGGNLFLLGGGAVPRPWQSFPFKTLPGGRGFDVGLGRCFIFSANSASKLDAADVKAMNSAVSDSARYWLSQPDENAANTSFPVVADVRIPVRSTVFVMLAFVIVIGPANLLVLSRLKRRIWLLWTVPAISFVTCLLVLAYSLLREGITPRVRIAGLTVLDQVERRADSIGMTAFYCPLTPSQGLSFGFDTEATPMLMQANYRFGSPFGSPRGTARAVDWSRTQHLETGWVLARVPAHFLLRKSATCRERLEVQTDAGRESVVNGLGAAVRFLWLADAAGRIYTATNIAAGQKAALAPWREHPQVTRQLGARALLQTGGYDPGAQQLAATAGDYLRPGTYLAVLDGEPFLENGLGAASARTRSRAVVYGIFGGTR